MAGDLKRRLERLRRFGDEGPPESSARPRRPRGGAFVGLDSGLDSGRCSFVGGEAPGRLAGWDRVDEFVWVRELYRPLAFPAAIDPLPFLPLGRLKIAAAAREVSASKFSVTLPGPGGALGSGFLELLGEKPISAPALRFFDLETTGLSGGSGTVAFLAAMGRLSGGRLEIRQLFLEDFPGERRWLELLLDAIPEDGVLVSYNGRSYDLPLLRARCAMNGLPPPEARQLDALHCSRRLWSRVHGGASLGLLESRVLGFERGEDLDAGDIPAVWFSFLRDGDSPLLGKVMSHNADDIEGLARLVAAVQGIFDAPQAVGRPPVDLGSLGRTLVAMGRGAEGAAILRSAFEAGDEAAGLALSRLYKKAGRGEERRDVVERLPSTCASCVERAKYYEHEERDWERALEQARRAEELAPAGNRVLASALARRCRRLEGLMEKAASKRLSGNPPGNEQAESSEKARSGPRTT